MSYKPHTNCRACGHGPSFGPGGIKSAAPTDFLPSVLDLGYLPLPNSFKKINESRPGLYPVELLVCPRCSLGQLSATVDPLVMYSDYAYITSHSKTMMDHFSKLWECLNRERKIETVCEIGSNDGLFLEWCKQNGALAVLGIDPAKNLGRIADQRGINTICSLFDRQAAEMARSCMPPLDLIIARHVFCHVDDWAEFINNIAAMCEKETVVCIEVPYAQDMIQKVEWDTIYSEHTSYLTLKAMVRLLEGSMLKIQNVHRFAIHGGAIAIILRRRDSVAESNGEFRSMLEIEDCSMERWEQFAVKARDQISDLDLMVRGFLDDGKVIAGYGASAKSTIWINACKFTRKEVRFIVDDTPGKQWTTSPGSNIPIVDPGAIARELPDYAILWAWNFEREILEKEAFARSKGVQFIIPTHPIHIV